MGGKAQVLCGASWLEVQVGKMGATVKRAWRRGQVGHTMKTGHRWQ